jgi:hypothetical protein
MVGRLYLVKSAVADSDALIPTVVKISGTNMKNAALSFGVAGQGMLQHIREDHYPHYFSYV